MAIEYIIDYKCLTRKHLTNDQFLALIEHRERAVYLLAMKMLEGNLSEEDARNSTLTLKRLNDEGKEVDEEISIGKLIDQTDVLEKLKPACEKCKASLGTTFGCFGNVRFPVSAKAEKWMVQLAAKAKEKGLPDSILIQMIGDNKISGDAFRQLRMSDADNNFELGTAEELVIGKKLFKKSTINTNQLMEALFGTEELDISSILYIMFFSGALQIVYEKPEVGKNCQHFFSTKDKEGKDNYYAYNMPESADDDDSIKDIKRYFKSLFMALSIGSQVVVKVK